VANRDAIGPKISIGRADRVALFGKTGSGKTTLARHLIGQTYARTRAPFVVFDPKRTYRQEGVPVHREFRPKDDRQIIRGDAFESNELDFWDDQMFRVWEHGHRLVYVDEATLVTPPRAILPSLGALIRTGRERGIATWVGSQRPKDLPSPIFTEAEHFFVGRLTWEHDRHKVVSFTHPNVGDELDRIKGSARKHDFVYFGVNDDRTIYLHMTQEEAPDGKRRRRRRAA
jgi:DNA helicase HerA-like ATPase